MNGARLARSRGLEPGELRGAEHGLARAVGRAVRVAMIAAVEHEQIDACVVVAEEHAGGVGESARGIGPVVAEDPQRIDAGRIGSIGVVETEVVIVPGRDLRHGGEQRLERGDVALAAVFLGEQLRPVAVAVDVVAEPDEHVRLRHPHGIEDALFGIDLYPGAGAEGDADRRAAAGAVRAAYGTRR